MDVLMPDGTTITGVPEGVTQSQLLARYGKYTAAQAPAAPQVGLPNVPPIEPSKPFTAEQYKAALEKRNQETPSRSVSDVALDTGITLLKGTIGLPESFVGLADIPTKGRIGKFLENAGYNPKEANAILDT